MLLTRWYADLRGDRGEPGGLGETGFVVGTLVGACSDGDGEVPDALGRRRAPAPMNLYVLFYLEHSAALVVHHHLSLPRFLFEPLIDFHVCLA